MLHKIVIENFFSIADRQELAFAVPGNAPHLPCFRPAKADQAMRLPVALGFFGPNASGKSTVLRAVISALLFACHSFNWENQLPEFFQPYKQKQWQDKPNKIMLEFDAQLHDETAATLFRYEVQIAHDSNTNHQFVLYEALSYAPKGKFRCLFERNGQNFSFGREFGISIADDPRTASIRTDASVMSTLAKLNHHLAIFLLQQLTFTQTYLKGIHKSVDHQYLLALYAHNTGMLKNLNQMLEKLDIGLERMEIAQGPQGLFAKFYHAGLDDCIFWHEESQGTQRFIEIFPRLFYALVAGNIALIDEIDVELHSLLLMELLGWFSDPEINMKGAQLLFTAHNATILDELEKEQVFFTEKPYGKPTQVYGAREIKGLRRGPSLMRKYLAGELGAVPNIG